MEVAKTDATMDEQTVIMAAFSGILLLAAGIAGAVVYQRMPAKQTPTEIEEEPVVNVAASTSPGKKKKPKKKSDKDDDDDDGTRSQLPPIAVGTKCWHRQAKQWVRIIKVYHDDLPPYYSVVMADGSERATVRARLDTEPERAAIVAVTERAEAEKRAEAAAAALLAEEAKPRKPTSGSDSKGGAKKRR